jgi:ligand-binding sensor domain-containing protein
MKICNFFLIISLLGIISQPTQLTPKSMPAASPVTSTTQEDWRTFTSANKINALTTQGNILWAGTVGGVVRWNTTDDSYLKYTVANGLAGNYVSAIASNPDGNLWVGTGSECSNEGECGAHGVNKFDGTTWTTYTTADGLASNGVSAIASDPSGNVWFGTNVNGVSKFDGSSWTTYTNDDGLAGNSITAIASDPAGNVWFGTNAGVSKFDGATWTTYTTADGLVNNVVTSLASDTAGNMWFGTQYYGISKFDGTSWTTYTAANGLGYISITAIASDSAGNVWVGTDYYGVRKFDGITWTTYTTDDGLPFSPITAIASDSGGDVWIGTHNEVSKFDGSHWTTYTINSGPVSNLVTGIVGDPAGNVWVGTQRCYEFYCVSEPWSKFDGNIWTTYNDISPIYTDDKTGNVWFGTMDGLSKFDGTNWTSYTSVNGLPNSNINAIVSDSAGNDWFGTDGYGVSKFDGTTWTTYTTADGLAGNFIYAITSDLAGNIWVGTDSGVSRFDGANWITYTEANGLAGNKITKIVVNTKGNVWIFTDNECSHEGQCIRGVSKFDGSSWTIYTTGDGLASNSIWAIASDPAGNLWLGTEGYGVSKFDGTTWTTYTTADGLAGNFVYAITSDPAGNVWFGTLLGCERARCLTAGVSKFDGSHWTTYTSANGLISNYVNSIASDASGNMWFGTQYGVSELYFNRSLNSNYASGAPGSFFNLASDHFPANQDTPVSVNGYPLGNVPVSSNGIFTFTLSTSNASEGIYIVKVGERPSVQVRLRLDYQEPIQPKEGNFPTLNIPPDIAFIQEFYLPVLRR